MFYYNKLPFLAEPIDILNELKGQLALNGVNKFEKFVMGSTHIQFNCPAHKGGQERRPSCGMTVVDIKEGNRLTPAGTVHCFQCGYTCSLSEMISNCFGYEDFGSFGDKWLAKNFLSVSVEQRKEIPLNFNRSADFSGITPTYITEDELSTYRYTHPYMYKRKLTDEVIELFDIGYDDHFEMRNKDGRVTAVLRCITFPVKDINGNCLFIGRRSVDMKVFHYPESSIKPVYGMYEIQQYAPNADKVYITESMINALTIIGWGFPAFALNGTGTPYQYRLLEKFPCREYVLCLDPDEAGFKGTQKLKDYFRGKKLISTKTCPPKKDVNDLEYEEFINIPEIY